MKQPEILAELRQEFEALPVRKPGSEWRANLLRAARTVESPESYVAAFIFPRAAMASVCIALTIFTLSLNQRFQDEDEVLAELYLEPEYSDFTMEEL